MVISRDNKDNYIRKSNCKNQARAYYIKRFFKKSIYILLGNFLQFFIRERNSPLSIIKKMLIATRNLDIATILVIIFWYFTMF